MVRLLAALLLSLALSGCGGGGNSGDPELPAGGGEVTLPGGGGEGRRQDDPDLAVGDPDLVAGEETVNPPEVTRPPGEGEFGEECTGDQQCASAICWANDQFSGCTVACTGHAQCQELGGLVCLPIREGLSGCVPPPPVGSNCASHQQCLFPTACLEQLGWCDLPECLWDSDCPAGEECEPAVRKCQPTLCESNYQCANPLEFCLDGQCGPPQCTKRSDCKPDEICSYAQGICTPGTPCNEEGKCSFYHQVCVDGLCEPNLCATPCANETYLCHPQTGICGPPCAGPGQCPAGWGCDQAAGVCYQNVPPAAIPLVQDDGSPKSAADVKAGTTVTLDGTASFDPEGKALTFQWTLIAKPAGASQNLGTIFCQQPTCQLGPLTAGLYHVGLWVTDEVGSASVQGLVAVYAK